LLVGFLGAFSAAIAQNSPHSNSGYIPQRVYDSAEKRFSDFEAMLAELARADVVLVGEQHDDPNTHRLERAILEGLARRRSSIVVALEMFERDVQGRLDEYLAGRLTEEEFLKAARPWPRYASDYRPLVEFARAHNWPVIAGNTPRRYASQVSKGGLAALDSLPANERAFIAGQIQCPFDDYYKRFAESMAEHPGATGTTGTTGTTATPGTTGGQTKAAESEQRAMIERFYFAQCIKDETMAESVANLYRESMSSRPLTVHFNGAFHSDYRLGTAARVKQRLPKASTKIVSIVPVENLDSLRPDEYRKRGDFVIFTLKLLKPAAESTGKP
jgi:uncharacterized iron-regulated protein